MKIPFFFSATFHPLPYYSVSLLLCPRSPPFTLLFCSQPAPHAQRISSCNPSIHVHWFHEGAVVLRNEVQDGF